MKRFITAAVLAAAIIAVAASAASSLTTPPGQEKKSGTTNLQLLTISDWHGQLTPLNGVGGAAALSTYLKADRAANPNSLTFMAGDSFGATPPISTFFQDEPAIKAMNMMGVDADTFGNHNFDGGIAHTQQLVDLADFQFVSANLRNLDANLTGVEKRTTFYVDGVKVAVIGITNEEAPTLVAPGAFGTIEITDSAEAANHWARIARTSGAQVVVILTHKGIRGFNADGSAFGELIDLANAVDPANVDVIVGDHTDFQYKGLHNGVLAVENKSKGVTYAKIQLAVDRATGVTSKSATFVTPTASAVTPDPAIAAYLADLQAQLAPIFGTVIGNSTVAIPRADSCGQSAGRTCESKIGNVVTDALRTTYGTDFAITNSGGLRADLTCPGAGTAGFCPTGITTPPFPITRGAVLGVLPFGNQSATTTVTGAEIKAFLENGVSRMPGVDGRYPQVSGLCFTYNIAATAGSRVTSIVRQAADGTCTDDAVAAGTNYTLATNDFVAAGGDGYPNVLARTTTRNLMDQDLADYVAAHSPLSPSLQGRIVCADSNGSSLPNCPAITAP